MFLYKRRWEVTSKNHHQYHSLLSSILLFFSLLRFKTTEHFRSQSLSLLHHLQIHINLSSIMVNFNRIACALAVAGIASSQGFGSDTQSYTGIPPSMGSGRPMGTGGNGPPGSRPTNMPSGSPLPFPSGVSFQPQQSVDVAAIASQKSGTAHGSGRPQHYGFPGTASGPRPTDFPSGSTPPFPSQSGVAVAAISAQRSGSAHGSGRPHHSGFAIGSGGHGGSRPTNLPTGARLSNAPKKSESPSKIAKRQASPSLSSPTIKPTGVRPTNMPSIPFGSRPTNLPSILSGSRPTNRPSNIPSGFAKAQAVQKSGTVVAERPTSKPTGSMKAPHSGALRPTQPPSGVPSAISPSGFVTKRRA
jgi:hypothetical protein